MSQEKEINDFLPDSQIITLSNGKAVEIKTLTWGKEIKVCQTVSKFFASSNLISIFSDLSKLKDDDNDNINKVTELIIPLIDQAPESITKIVSLVIDEDEQYVQESLTSDDVMKVLLPFLKRLFNKYTKMFQTIK